jgi:hypothetical protein
MDGSLSSNEFHFDQFFKMQAGPNGSIPPDGDKTRDVSLSMAP